MLTLDGQGKHPAIPRGLKPKHPPGSDRGSVRRAGPLVELAYYEFEVAANGSTAQRAALGDRATFRDVGAVDLR